MLVVRVFEELYNKKMKTTKNAPLFRAQGGLFIGN